MKRLHILLTVLLPVLPCTAAGALDTMQIVERNEPFVIVITGQRAGGGEEVQSSGCVVSESGMVLTTAHQVHGVEGLRGRFSDGSAVRLEVVAMDEGREIALLRADRTFLDVPRLGSADMLRKGEELISIAAPRNIEFTVVPGTVANTHATLRNYPVLLAAMRAAPGSSGGPVFDRRGLLVGLIIGKLRDEDWLTAVNPVDNAFDMLREHGAGAAVPAAEASRGETLLPAPGIAPHELQAVEAYNHGVRVRDSAPKVAAYRQAVSLLPAFYQAWFNLGVALDAACDRNAAEQAYRAALQVAPGAIETWRNLGRLLLAGKRLEEAAEVFAEARKLAPAEAQSHNDYGEACRRLERLDEAVAAFEEAVRLDAGYAMAYYNLGLAQTARGDAERAARAFQAYLELRPDAEDAEEVRGWLGELAAGNGEPGR